MKKQFFRVKQLADQTFLRAEKSEILNHEELQIADQKTEFLRNAITTITKKIAPSGPTNDTEKLMKKCFEYQLGSSFIEEGRQYRECPLFQQVLGEAGLIEQQLAREYAEHEMKVEEMVYSPLQSELENEFPNIIKHKHNLRKYCLDKDSASNRYHATRKETLKEDMEEADTKVEQSRDMLAIEMFNVLAKENEFSEYILQLLKLQRGYHESALKNLESVIPQLEKIIGNSPIRRVFGTSLQEHLRITSKKIAFPLEICITALSEYGMLEEGLFRVAASATKVKRLKSAIDSGCFSWLIPEYRDAHVLASILKLYLRELPEPLLTFQLHKEWIEAMQYQENKRLRIVKSIIEKLPQENKDNLSYLFQFLFKFTQHTENKMSPSNIAIVLSPSLLWTKNEDVNIGNCVTINMLIELFIKEAKFLFPDDVSKYVTVMKIMQDEEILNHNKINNDMNLKVGSPKPNVRKKKSAPVPPNNEKVITCNLISPNVEQKENPVSLDTTLDDSIRYESYLQTEDNVFNCQQDIKNKNSKSIDTMHLEENCADDILDKPTVKKYETVISHTINQLNTPSAKPILKDKPILGEKPDQSATPLIKPQNTIDSYENVKKKEPNIRTTKPEVPVRPLSLTVKKLPSDAVIKRTHCSVYNVADKLQPSIINIERDNLSEKTLNSNKPENYSCSKGYTAIKNENCSNVPSELLEIAVHGDNKKAKSSEQLNINRQKVNLSSESINAVHGDNKKAKSSEQLNVITEKVNLSSANVNSTIYNHVRAKSDGGVTDVVKENNAFLPASSCNVNKLVQPPSPLEI